MDECEIYDRAWSKWKGLQFQMVIEECSELIKAVCKYFRNNNPETLEHIAEETADVEVMCGEIRRFSPEMNEMVNKYKKEKLARLEKMLVS